MLFLVNDDSPIMEQVFSFSKYFIILPFESAVDLTGVCRACSSGRSSTNAALSPAIRCTFKLPKPVAKVKFPDIVQGSNLMHSIIQAAVQ